MAEAIAGLLCPFGNGEQGLTIVGGGRGAGVAHGFRPLRIHRTDLEDGRDFAKNGAHEGQRGEILGLLAAADDGVEDIEPELPLGGVGAPGHAVEPQPPDVAQAGVTHELHVGFEVSHKPDEQPRHVLGGRKVPVRIARVMADASGHRGDDAGVGRHLLDDPPDVGALQKGVESAESTLCPGTELVGRPFRWSGQEDDESVEQAGVWRHDGQDRAVAVECPRSPGDRALPDRLEEARLLVLDQLSGPALGGAQLGIHERDPTNSASGMPDLLRRCDACPRRSPERSPTDTKPMRPAEPTLVRALGRSSTVARHYYRLASPRVPPGQPPIRLAHLTDVHVGRMTPEARLAGAVDAINALRPDVVCLTGDYIAHSLRYLPRLTHHLRALTAPAFATLGNHDHWHGASTVVRALEAAGIMVLENASTVVAVGGGRWRIVGLDDAVTGHHDPERAFREVDEVPFIVLSHLAELAGLAERRGAALVLSGHTHGGQIPAGGVMERVMRRMGHRYILGWYHVGQTPVYVNRGLGAAVFPWRTHPAGAEVAGIDLIRPAGGTTADGGPEVEERLGLVDWPASLSDS